VAADAELGEDRRQDVRAVRELDLRYAAASERVTCGVQERACARRHWDSASAMRLLEKFLDELLAPLIRPAHIHGAEN
jgi:hypothetical protein